jgi:RHS repeat-associated protein
MTTPANNMTISLTDPFSGSLTNLWSSSGNGVTNVYQYDVLGRLTTVVASNVVAATYGYDVVGNLQTLRYANGVTNLYQYDSRNRLTNLVWRLHLKNRANFGYTVGPTGNRTALVETVAGIGCTYNWAYDYLYRMTGETFNGTGFAGSPSVTYGFDAVGNRTNRTSTVSGINPRAPTYTTNDWLASDAFDSSGNTTNSGTANYQYDALNHLTNANNGQILITYDGDGNRVSKTVNGTTTYYLVDDRNPSGYAQVLEEYQGSSLSRVYNYGLALVSQRQASSGTISYYGSDGHGSTRFLTDVNGIVTDSYTFDAYGLLLSSTGQGTTNNYLYCGQQFDSDLGFYYLRARYYKPDSGRFWTMDTSEGDTDDPLSLHKYLYCQGSPVNRIDPKGLADFALRIIYAGVDTGTSFGVLGDPETWGGGAAGVWYTLGDDFSRANVVVGPVGESDNLFAAVSGKIASLNLKPGTDRITKITIYGHGAGGYLGTWNNGSSAITLASLQSKTPTPQLSLMKYLNPWTSGHCDVSLQACFQAVDGDGKKMMALMAQLLNANVTGFDDEVAVKGWGNQWTVDSKGNWTMKKGSPFKGSWADVGADMDAIGDFLGDLGSVSMQ